jgi:hypothetical protein
MTSVQDRRQETVYSEFDGISSECLSITSARLAFCSTSSAALMDDRPREHVLSARHTVCANESVRCETKRRGRLLFQHVGPRSPVEVRRYFRVTYSLQ